MMESEWKQMEKTTENKSSRVETGEGGDGGEAGCGEGGRPAAVENLFKSHMQPEGEAERVPFIQTLERKTQSNRMYSFLKPLQSLFLLL